MPTLKQRLIPAAVFFAAALLHCSPAAAATVTYNFTDPGWINMAGVTENFSGSFIGTPEASGVIALNDLTIFVGFFTETNAQNETKTIATFGDLAGITGLTQFLFDPNANTLTLAATGTPGAQICLGDAVAQGTCGAVTARPVNRNGIPAPPIEGLFVSSVNGTLSGYDTDLPAIMLAPSPVGIAPQPAQATTPEPASLLLCALGFVALTIVFRRHH